MSLSRYRSVRKRGQRDAGFTLTELLIAVAILAVITAIAILFSANTFAMFRLGGDARMVLNAVSVAKMRAAANFTLARVRVNLGARTHQIEVLQKGVTPAWIGDGDPVSLSTNDNFGFGATAVAPPNTQAAIAQSPQCLSGAGAAISGTACMLFNSRGIPVDTTGAPTGGNAIYINDGVTVFAVTLSASGQLRLWRSLMLVGPTWIQQ